QGRRARERPRRLARSAAARGVIDRRRPMGRRAWRIAKRVAIGAIALVVLWLVGMNSFLSTGGLRAVLDPDPDVLWVDYASARSIVPGRVHATNLRIRGQDSHVQWLLTIDTIDFTVSLHELLAKHFHVTEARGSGISFVVRRRLDRADATPEA